MLRNWVKQSACNTQPFVSWCSHHSIHWWKFTQWRQRKAHTITDCTPCGNQEERRRDKTPAHTPKDWWYQLASHKFNTYLAWSHGQCGLLWQHVSGCRWFSDMNISQSSVVTRLRCHKIIYYCIIANLLLNLTLKGFWKLASIWLSYRQKYTPSGIFYSRHGVDSANTQGSCGDMLMGIGALQFSIYYSMFVWLMLVDYMHLSMQVLL